MMLSLVSAAAVLALLACLVLGRVLPPRVLIPCVLIKFAVPVAYFAWFADGRWMLIDDVVYLRQGLALASAGYDPVSVLLSRAGLQQLIVLSEGLHILYGWFNLVAVYLIGPWYFSPVLLNVFVSCISGRVLWGFARDAGFGPRYRTGLTAFFLLHWDVLAWSSFVNLKDTVIVLLTLLLLRALARFQARLARRDLLVALAVSFVFLWIRFYVPAVAGAAVVLRSLATGGVVARHRWITLGIVAIAMGGMFWVMGPRWLPLLSTRLELEPWSVGQGLVRMLLTPQPWSVSRGNDFLLLPSILHVVAFVPALIGGLWLWQRSPMLRLPLVYSLLILLLFSTFPAQQGPRHRLQVVFMLVWAQYTFAWQLLRAADAAVIAPLRTTLRTSP
jgi:hypothetical protein